MKQNEERLRPAHRLRKKSEFDTVFKTGQRRHWAWLGLVAAPMREAAPKEAGGPNESRLGIVMPKAVGTAVARNRARRWIREAFRLNRRRMKTGYDLVILGRKGIAESSYQEVEERLLGLAKGLNLLRDDAE